MDNLPEYHLDKNGQPLDWIVRTNKVMEIAKSGIYTDTFRIFKYAFKTRDPIYDQELYICYDDHKDFSEFDWPSDWAGRTVHEICGAHYKYPGTEIYFMFQSNNVICHDL